MAFKPLKPSSYNTFNSFGAAIIYGGSNTTKRDKSAANGRLLF